MEFGLKSLTSWEHVHSFAWLSQKKYISQSPTTNRPCDLEPPDEERPPHHLYMCGTNGWAINIGLTLGSIGG